MIKIYILIKHQKEFNLIIELSLYLPGTNKTQNTMVEFCYNNIMQIYHINKCFNVYNIINTTLNKNNMGNKDNKRVKVCL